MTTIYSVYLAAMKDGKEAGVLSNDLRILLAHNQGYERPIDVLYFKDQEIKDLPLFEEQYARLKKGEPVEYIINEARFLEHKLFVDPRVLIPRPETEELIANLSERICSFFDPRNYLVCADIGTGSGAIPVALKTFFPHWVLLANDVSSDALDVAKKNFLTYEIRVQSFLGSSLKPYIDNNIKLDIIISNPPYILEPDTVQDSVKDYEPSLALYLNKDESVYEDIFKNYKEVKKGALYMAFEIAPDLVDWLTSLMKQYLKNYEYAFVDDLDGKTRFLFIYLE